MEEEASFYFWCRDGCQAVERRVFFGFEENASQGVGACVVPWFFLMAEVDDCRVVDNPQATLPSGVLWLMRSKTSICTFHT